MADAKDYAFKGLDVLGGIGGAIVGAVGGGNAGAQGVQSGFGAIKDLVTMAMGDDAQPSPRDTNMRRHDAPMARPVVRRFERESDAPQERARSDAGGAVSSEQAAVWVSSLASRLVLAMAYGAVRIARQEEPDDVWTLAIVLIRRYADRFETAERQAVAIALQPIRGLTDAARRVEVDAWSFVRAARGARDDPALQDAGAAFASLVESMGLDAWKDTIRGAGVATLRDAVQARLPIPEALITHYAEILRAPQQRARSARADELHPHAERAGYAPHSDLDHDAVMAGLIGTETEKIDETEV